MSSLCPPTPYPLSGPLLEAIAASATVLSFAAHTVLITEHDATDALYIILSGRVKAYGASGDGREVIYSTQGPGEYFGEMTLDGGPRSASVMTLEPTRCAVVPGTELRRLLAEQPDFAIHLMFKLISLVRASTDRVKSLALDDVYGRVTKLLKSLALPGADGVPVVSERLSQQDIADRVGSSREMVSRVLKQLTVGGYVEQRDGRIALLKKLPAGW